MGKANFKGKSYETGEWTEGFYYEQTDVFDETIPYLYRNLGPDKFEKVRIRPETLCESTGLVDHEGREIFENDVVSCPCGFAIGGMTRTEIVRKRDGAFEPFAGSDFSPRIRPESCFVVGNAIDEKTAH